jgi:hypothetical protein
VGGGNPKKKKKKKEIKIWLIEKKTKETDC